MKEINVEGKVIKGNKRGGKIGFPTANVALDKKIESGVFLGVAKVKNKKYQAVIFVGRSGKVLEAHLLNFSGDLYGQEIKVKIKKKIREVMDFKSDEELKEQIKEDIKNLVDEI